jgi:DnaJ-class molecular chaperone
VIVAKSPRIECNRCGGDGREMAGFCNKCDGYGSVHSDSLKEY